MADGGKPLGEAKIKLSVEGADQVRAELDSVSRSAKKGVQDVSAFVREQERFEKVNKELVDSIKAEEQALIDAQKAIRDAGIAAEVAEQRLAGLHLEQSRLTEGISELAAAEALATGTMQDHTVHVDRGADSIDRAGKNIRTLVGQYTRLVATASAVAGALASVSNAIQQAAEFADFYANKTKDLDEILKSNGGNLVPANLQENEKLLADVRMRLEEVNAELALVLEKGGPFARALSGNDGAAFQTLTEGFGRSKAAIEGNVEALKQQEEFLVRNREAFQKLLEVDESRAAKAMIQADIEAANASARATVQGEYLATLTEEEQYLKRIEALEKARAQLASQGGSPRDIQAIIERVKAEYAAKQAAERQAEEDKRKADEERAREQEQRDKERRDKDAEARRKQIEDEANARIRSQQSVFDAARRESERSLQAIAVTTAQATQLLRAINTSQSGGQPWQ